MSESGDDPYKGIASYEGGDFFKVADQKGMVSSLSRQKIIGRRINGITRIHDINEEVSVSID